MSSCKLDSDGVAIINDKNIVSQTKLYKEFKRKKNWETFDQYSDYISRFWQINFYEDKQLWQKKVHVLAAFFRSSMFVNIWFFKQ